MSIVINGVSYHYDNRNPIFENISFSVAGSAKVSLIGNNGAGKSTLLRLVAGLLKPSGGEVACTSLPYYVPQQAGLHGMSVARALGVEGKLAALRAITEGSTSQTDYDALGDDWDVEARCEAALARWQLPDTGLYSPVDVLSGGEKTKVLLAGLSVHEPDIVLLDEPTNHLDTAARDVLYDYIGRTRASAVVVSHDVTLLDMLDATYELSPRGLKLYGGNYAFYKEQKALEANALEEDIQNREKELRLARAKAQEVKQRQERREGRGERHKDQLTRGMRKKALNQGEETGARLQGKHEQIIREGNEKLGMLRSQRDTSRDLKIDFDDATLHEGKLLVKLSEVNHEYVAGRPLWDAPLSLEIHSGDRLHLKGGNGSGKTTLVRMMTGELQPASGSVWRTNFSYVYLDQEYSMADGRLTVLEMAEEYNTGKLPGHEVKTRLHRALFPAETWDKPCSVLSGGERMRLCLCCLMLSNHMPDMFILDEPTNNLDIASLEILTRTIRDYRGSLILITHDRAFAAGVGVNAELDL